MFDKFKEECGVFGIYGHPEAANLTYLGLYALQHRGQESAGIVSSDGYSFFCEKGMGLVSDIFSGERLKRLQGSMAIGHTRYSTTGESILGNVQPILVNYALGTISLSHNGNLINAGILRDELEAYGAIFQSTIDSEVIVHLIAHSREGGLLQRVVDALNRIRGAFSIIFLSESGLMGVRDPHGLRPLSLGRIKDGWVIASETCAFDLIEAEFVRDIEPGELVVINEKGLESYRPFPHVEPAPCIFEYIYFARPDSIIFGHDVYSIRKALGRELANEAPVRADMVIPVPDSGAPAALGFAEGSGIPYEMGLIRNHYVGRTFIEPQQSIRHFGVKIKLNPVANLLKGKRVVVVDDSLVRGTTSRKIVKMIKHAGAKEVHMRIASPPISHPCFYGIDTPTRRELIASSHSIDEVRRYITAGSLAYLSIDGMLRTVPKPSVGAHCNVPLPSDNYCIACFSGSYPIPFKREEIRQPGLFEGV